MKKYHVFLTILISIFLIPSLGYSKRGISVIEDLSHKSGKLGAYKALVIGINDYQDPKIPDLKSTVNDAKAMANLLSRKYGFSVDLMLNRQATRAKVIQKLRKLALNSRPDDSILFYYAGHGDIDRVLNDGWWIPVDATGGDPSTYLDNTIVQKVLRSMKSKHILLISDSCYSGTLFGQVRSIPSVIDDKYYLSLYNEKSRWGMTSGNKTPVSDQGSEGHSVFAYQLLKTLRNNTKPYISTHEIYARIAPIIANNSEQTPMCRPIRNTNDQGGQFIFVVSTDTTLPVENKVPSVSTIPQSTVDNDAIFWQSIQNSNDPSLFEAYINEFPNGTFVSIAKIKIRQLSTPKKSAEKNRSEVISMLKHMEVPPKRGRYIWDPTLRAANSGKKIVLFEALGKSDIVVAFARTPEDDSALYEIVIGGWGNTQSVIRKGRQTPHGGYVRVNRKQNPNAMISSYWDTYWVTVENGHIKVGKSAVHKSNAFLEWTDPNPIQNPQWIGFSSWDRKFSLRNIRILNE